MRKKGGENTGTELGGRTPLLFLGRGGCGLINEKRKHDLEEERRGNS